MKNVVENLFRLMGLLAIFVLATEVAAEEADTATEGPCVGVKGCWACEVANADCVVLYCDGALLTDCFE